MVEGSYGGVVGKLQGDVCGSCVFAEIFDEPKVSKEQGPEPYRAVGRCGGAAAEVVVSDDGPGASATKFRAAVVSEVVVRVVVERDSIAEEMDP